MYDWNQNGKYDMQDSYIDYKLANSTGSSGGRAKGGWGFVLLCIICMACPPLMAILGFVFIIIAIFK